MNQEPMTLSDRLSDCLPKVGEPEAKFCMVDTADLRAALEMLHHGRAVERERCAKLCEAIADEHPMDARNSRGHKRGARVCAEAIRTLA